MTDDINLRGSANPKKVLLRNQTKSRITIRYEKNGKTIRGENLTLIDENEQEYIISTLPSLPSFIKLQKANHTRTNNDPIPLVVIVKPDDSIEGTRPELTGTAYISVNGWTSTKQTLIYDETLGYATCKITWENWMEGVNNITLTYDGDETYAPISRKINSTITVNHPTV